MLDLADKLNEPGQRLYRTALRDTCFRLLNSVELPGKEAQAGRAWLQAPGRTTRDMERLRERTLERLREVRADQALKAAYA